jgi:hypothetical protein
MTQDERHQLALLSRRAYDLEVRLGLATHHVGNVEGGDTDALFECCEQAQEIRQALERVGGVSG